MHGTVALPEYAYAAGPGLKITWSSVQDRAANSTKFYSSLSSSSTYLNKSEFKFEFSNLIIYEFDKNKLFRVQADEYPKSRQLFHRRCSCN